MKSVMFYLSDEAAEAWTRFGETNGVPKSAVAEVIGHRLGEGDTPVGFVDDVVGEARAVAAARRRRI